MKRPQNYSVSFEPHGKTHECDNFTCGHCGRIVMVPVGSSAYEIGGGCRSCEQLICSGCVDKGKCRPLEEWLLTVERRCEQDRMWNRLTGR